MGDRLRGRRLAELGDSVLRMLPTRSLAGVSRGRGARVKSCYTSRCGKAKRNASCWYESPVQTVSQSVITTLLAWRKSSDFIRFRQGWPLLIASLTTYSRSSASHMCMCMWRTPGSRVERRFLNPHARRKMIEEPFPRYGGGPPDGGEPRRGR